MTKSNTKRALLSSVLAMILCLGLLIGTTFAWFTDSVTSSGNKIKAGTLDIQLLMDGDVDGTYDDISNNNSPIFGEGSIAQNNNAETLWEPGKTQVAYLAIKNNGNLALKYTVGLDVQNVSKDLYEVMEYAIVPDADANHKVTSWTSGNSVEVGTQSVSGDVSLPVGATHCFALVIHMDEEAGNEYQGGEVNFDLTVLATQDTVESDSFNNQYDKDAVYGDVMVSSDAELKAAIEDSDMKVIAVNGDLTYDWGSESYENSKALLMKGKTFLGANEAASITFAGYGSANPIVDATFRNITIKDSTVGDNEASWEHGYLEFKNLNAVNVTFADSIMLDGDNSLMNCAMNNTISGWYGIWIEGGNTVIKNSSFRGTRSVKIHEAYGTDVESVVIDNCVFGSLSEKPGVVIGDLNAATKVTIKNSTFVNCQAGDQDKYIYESDTDVTTFAFSETNNEVVGGVTTVADATEILAATAGGDLFLTDDVSYNNTDPEKQLILEATNAINFNGNGSTITSAGADPSVGNHGYVAFVPSAGEDVTVSDLTVTGTGFVELGHYGLGGGDYVANNLVVKDLVSTLANGDKGFTLACGFAHYGNATLNDCVMTGTTAMIDGAMAVDAGFVNGTTTTVNGGKYGTIYCWSHANVTIDDAEIDTIYVSPIKGNVTIKAGTVIDNLIVDYGTSASNVTKARLEKLVIEDGAEVGAIVYNGTTYTVAEWNVYLATL